CHNEPRSKPNSVGPVCQYKTNAELVASLQTQQSKPSRRRLRLRSRHRRSLDPCDHHSKPSCTDSGEGARAVEDMPQLSSILSENGFAELLCSGSTGYQICRTRWNRYCSEQPLSWRRCGVARPPSKEAS